MCAGHSILQDKGGAQHRPWHKEKTSRAPLRTRSCCQVAHWHMIASVLLIIPKKMKGKTHITPQKEKRRQGSVGCSDSGSFQDCNSSKPTTECLPVFLLSCGTSAKIALMQLLYKNSREKSIEVQPLWSNPGWCPPEEINVLPSTSGYQSPVVNFPNAIKVCATSIRVI